MTRLILPVVLAIPGAALFVDAVTLAWSDENFESWMHTSGELSARLLIVTLLATPLQRVQPTWKVVKWLRRRRRTFGVASFGYALLHLVLYVGYRAPELASDLLQATYAFGWIAFLILLPLAVTSTQGWLARLGNRRWHALHRAVYVAAFAVAGHWLLKPDGDTLVPVLIHFTPLLLLELNRIRLHLRRARPQRA
jgi:sulfoxide reductase heme-binding subunit YedZ